MHRLFHYRYRYYFREIATDRGRTRFDILLLAAALALLFV